MGGRGRVGLRALAMVPAGATVPGSRSGLGPLGAPGPPAPGQPAPGPQAPPGRRTLGKRRQLLVGRAGLGQAPALLHGQLTSTTNNTMSICAPAGRCSCVRERPPARGSPLAAPGGGKLQTPDSPIKFPPVTPLQVSHNEIGSCRSIPSRQNSFATTWKCCPWCPPEVAAWLERRGAGPLAPPAPGPVPGEGQGLSRLKPRAGGITLVVGGGLLDEVALLLERMPAGHQVFCLQPGPSFWPPPWAATTFACLWAARSWCSWPPPRPPWRRRSAATPAQSHRPDGDGAPARRPGVRGGGGPGQALPGCWATPFGPGTWPWIGRCSPGPTWWPTWCTRCSRPRPGPARLAHRPAGGAWPWTAPSLPESLELLAGNLGGAVFFCSDRALPRVPRRASCPAGWGWPARPWDPCSPTAIPAGPHPPHRRGGGPRPPPLGPPRAGVPVPGPPGHRPWDPWPPCPRPSALSSTPWAVWPRWPWWPVATP